LSLYEARDGVAGLSISEWDGGEVPGVQLSARDLRLTERLRNRRRDTAVDVRPTESGVRVEARGAVGFVRFEEFELRIEPKFPGDHLQLFRMVEFAEGVSGITQLTGTPRLRFAEHNLLDLVVHLLTELSKRLLAAGLRADYVEHEGPLPALRGRLLPDRQVLDRLGLFDRVVCRYDEHEQDIPDNQLLALALGIGARVAQDRLVRRRARALAAMFEDFCDPAAFPVRLGREAIAYDRMNERYRPAHQLAWLLYEGLGPHDLMVAGENRVQSFLIDLSRLFERFLEKLLPMIAPAGFRVEPQREVSIFWDADRRAPYGRIRPDLIIQSEAADGPRLALDAKYKRYSRAGGETISAEDLSQVFLYAYAFRNQDRLDPPVAFIVYPSEARDGADLVHLEVRSTADRLVQANVTAIGVHIPSVLEKVASGSSRPLAELPLAAELHRQLFEKRPSF
jgi:5-methylcytosine-specific restriction enzyme subunit McrC